MFVDVNQFDENGKKVAELNGLDAISYLKSLRSNYNGEVTPEKLKEALKIYQSTVAPHGEKSIYSGEFPTALYQKILPVEALLGRLPEAFSDPKTGQAKKQNGHIPGRYRPFLWADARPPKNCHADGAKAISIRTGTRSAKI